jgi:hypothetical protein
MIHLQWETAASPAVDAVSPAGDVDVSAGYTHLPREIRYLLREISSHLQISGYVILLYYNQQVISGSNF